MKLLLTNCEKCPNAIDKTQKTVIMTYGAKKTEGNNMGKCPVGVEI